MEDGRYSSLSGCLSQRHLSWFSLIQLPYFAPAVYEKSIPYSLGSLPSLPALLPAHADSGEPSGIRDTL